MAARSSALSRGAHAASIRGEFQVKVQFRGQDQENAERPGKGQDLGLGQELANRNYPFLCYCCCCR